MSTISMYWWREQPNFGDALAPVIVAAISGRNPVWQHQSPRLLAIGSIIHHALPGDTIWGSGVHNLRQCEGRSRASTSSTEVEPVRRCMAIRRPYCQGSTRSASNQSASSP
jgi:hypothetical protein